MVERLIDLVSARFAPTAGHDELRGAARAAPSPLCTFVDEVCGRWGYGAEWIETHLRGLRPGVEDERDALDNELVRKSDRRDPDSPAGERRCSRGDESTREPTRRLIGDDAPARSPKRRSRTRRRHPVSDEGERSRGSLTGPLASSRAESAAVSDVDLDVTGGAPTRSELFAAPLESFESVVAPWDCLPTGGEADDRREPRRQRSRTDWSERGDWSARGF